MAAIVANANSFEPAWPRLGLAGGIAAPRPPTTYMIPGWDLRSFVVGLYRQGVFGVVSLCVTLRDVWEPLAATV